MVEILDNAALHAVMAERPHWEVRDGALVRSVQAPTYAAGIRLVNAVASAAEKVGHHPDIAIRWTTVTFRLWTHVAGGITKHDAALATTVDDLIDEVLPA
ncbi:MAG TPA: 4a-hydroxytetrahydrobiopterin dehydratase [Nocardioidaceae bacterium]|nr:4a-hydroxytetrahydrobiopterin dehydratase [Nocardioidaceae bacterium]